MDGVGFAFHVNRKGMVVHVETFGVTGPRYLPLPKISCLGKTIISLYDEETGKEIQTAIDHAFNNGPSEHCFIFSHKMKYHDFISTEMVGKAAYLSDEKVLVVLEPFIKRT